MKAKRWLRAKWRLLLLTPLTLCVTAMGASLPGESSIWIDWAHPFSTPTYDRGFVFFQHFDVSRGGPHYTVFTRGGKLTARIRISVPDVREVIPRAIAALPDGSGYLIACVVERGSARGSRLVWVNAAGELVRMAKLSPVWPGFLRIADDGSIWILGADTREPASDSAAPVLYRYSPQGELVDSFIPRSALGPGGLEGAVFLPSREKGNSALVLAGSRVYAYEANAGKLFEVDTQTRALRSWDVEAPPIQKGDPGTVVSMRVAGLAGTAAGELYALLARGTGNGMFRFDRNSGLWRGAGESVLPNHAPVLGLLGSDGEDLLVWGNPSQREVALRLWRPSR